MAMIQLPDGTAAIPTLEQALAMALQGLVNWANSNVWYEQLLHEVFNTDATSPEAESLRQQIESGTAALTLKTLPDAVLGPAFGAYAGSGTNSSPTIYLNGTWLEQASVNEVEAVLLEELGHWVDDVLHHGADTLGDEGELFAARLLGLSPQPEVISQDDHIVLSLDSGPILAEASSPPPSPLPPDRIRPTGTVIIAASPAFAAALTNPFGLVSGRSYYFYSAQPVFADIDADGDLDVFIGINNGSILFQRNTAGIGAILPSYDAVVSTNPFGLATEGTGYAAPTLVDIDGDQDLDLFLGNQSGNVLFFRNTGSAYTPVFAAPSTSPFGIAQSLTIGTSSNPTFVDVDSDGDQDLFIGSNSGIIFFQRNTAAAGSSIPAFAAASSNPFGLSAVNGSSRPTFADVDRDGDLDALIGERSGNIVYFRNTAAAGSTQPSYSAPTSNPFGSIDVGDYATPELVDNDGDSDLDLFIGTQQGTTLYFQNTAPLPIVGITSVNANGTYTAGQAITLRIQFSEPVLVDTTFGSPTILLETGSRNRHAHYSKGSTTNTLEFIYIVQPGDSTADLDQVSDQALLLNGATIKDVAGNVAIITLAKPGQTGSLGSGAAFVINAGPLDTVQPRGTNGLLATNPAYASATSVLDAGSFSSPTFTDLDRDGNLDLIVGTKTGLVTYRNTAPEDAFFSSYAPTNFGPIYTQGSYLSPIFADIDADGDLDLFYGQKSGATHFVKNIAQPNAAAPIYQDPVTNPFGITSIIGSASPSLADSDKDGDLDLWIGGSDGNIRYYQNTGSDLLPAFTTPVSNPFGLTDVGSFASPVFVDIDADLDLDLLIGNLDGNTLLFRNTASSSASNPSFAAGLINPLGLPDVGFRAKPAVADIDRDGDLDLLIGNSVGEVLFVSNTASVPYATVQSQSPNGSYGIGDSIIIALTYNETVYINRNHTSEFAAAQANPFGITGARGLAFADLDGDNDLDAFATTSVGDTIFYRNTGSSSQPLFVAEQTNPFGITNLPGTVAYGGQEYSRPVFEDLDRDGDLDYIVGLWDGSIVAYLNTAGPSTSLPEFGPALTNPYGFSQISSIGWRAGARLSFVDIDSDGDKDCFTSSLDSDNIIYFFKNTAASGAPASFVLAPPGVTGNMNLYGLDPAFADIDGDGDYDLLARNAYNSLVLYRNQGTTTQAAFVRELEKPFGTGSIGYSDSLTPTFADIDSDGDQDLFLTQRYSTSVFFVENITGLPSLDLRLFQQEFQASGPGGVTLTPSLIPVTRQATYSSGNGSNTLLFEYIVQEGDNAADLSLVDQFSLNLNNGSITDLAGNSAGLLLANPGSVGSLNANSNLNVDGDRPRGNLRSGAPIRALTPNGSYGAGEHILLTVRFSETVFVTIDNGIPQLRLETGDFDQVAIYESGSGTSTLTFRYVVQPGDRAALLEQLDVNALELNGGSIKDGAGNQADLGLAVQGEAGALSRNARLIIDTQAPSGNQFAAQPFFIRQPASNWGLINTGDASNLTNYRGISLADFDLDGDQDFLAFGANSGTDRISLYINQGTLAVPRWVRSDVNPFGLSKVPGTGSFRIGAAPLLIDIDGDADLDSLIGDESGNTFLSYNTGNVASPSFSASIPNPFGLSDVGTSATPARIDIDLDGDLDLLIGNRDGNLALFRNTASTSSSTPAYTAALTNPFGLSDVGFSATPTFVDIDADGDADLILGEVNGRFIFFQNTAPVNSNTPAYASPITNPFGLVDIGSYSAPTFADLDADGRVDLLSGSRSGDLLFFKNTGSTAAPAFASPSTNPFGIQKVGKYAVPILGDLDADSDLDLLVSDEYGNSVYFRNTGSSSAPAFTSDAIEPFGINGIGQSAFADIDKDGDLDLFLGQFDGNMLFLRNIAPPLSTTPRYATASTNPFGLTDLGYWASPTFADIDKDGDLDLFIGNGDGNTIFYRNTATPGATAPSFTLITNNPFGLADVGENAAPSFADIDGDGDLDLLVGCNALGSGAIFINTAPATSTAPSYRFRELSNVYGPVATDLIDLDGDQDLDFIRVEDGQLYLYSNVALASGPIPVRSLTPNGTYGTGSIIQLSLSFNETVYINTTNGLPTLQLETGLTDRFATYAGGSGTNTLRFSYTVQAGDSSADLDVLSSSAFQLNGSTIQDAAGNNAILTLAAPGQPGSLAANSQLVIDGGPAPAQSFSAFSALAEPALFSLAATPDPLPQQLTDFNRIATLARFRELTAFNGKLLFSVNNGTLGEELWLSDATPTGTRNVRDIRSGSGSSQPTQLTPVGSTLFFSAFDATAGKELWKTNANPDDPAGTSIVSDLLTGSGSSTPNHLTNVNGQLFFAASSANAGPSNTLWSSNGSTSTQLKSFSGEIKELAAVNGSLFISVVPTAGASAELWRSNGTAATTSLISSFNNTYNAWPEQLTALGSTLLFSSAQDPEGVELWGHNTVTGSTSFRVRDIHPTKDVTYILNPTYASTASYVVGYPNTNSLPKELTPSGGFLYFSADDGTLAGRELWKSDGTTVGTQLVSDLTPGYWIDNRGVRSAVSSNPADLEDINGTLFFRAFNPGRGYELWASNGTAAGTTEILDIRSGPGSSRPENLVHLKGLLFFSADDGINGRELWMSDGTAAGTRIVTDLLPGSGSSNPSNLTASGDSLFFSATDAAGFTELWSYTPTVNILLGTDSNDSLVGTNGIDNIDALAGNDTVRAGGGHDSINGGSGTDTADFSDTAATVVLTLNTSTAAIVSIGGTAADSLVNIENIWGGSAADTITGDVNANTLYGNAGNDTLSGAAGNDSLRGGTGNDSLNGGDGTDTADFSDKTTAILLTLNSSTAANATIGTEIDSLINIENILGGSGADNITGDANNNSFRGGGGNDTLNGGSGTDTADFSDKTTAILLTLNGSTAANATIGTEIDSVINIESAWGGSGNDVLTGDVNANTLYGNAGNDTLSGAAGNDSLRGGTGNDSLNGGDGTDTADFSDKTTAILLTLNGSTAANATIGTEIDSLINIENAWGGSAADTITGDVNANTLYGNAGNDTLSGAAGNDSLRGGTGNDSLNGGDGTDTADFSDKTTAILLTLNGSTAANATIGTEIDSLINIENILGGSGADNITGDANNNSFRGGGGNDTLNGGSGTDTADFSDKTTAILLTLNGSTAANATIGTEIDSVINIESVFGGSGADNITGDVNANTLYGNAGNDTLSGAAGNDSLRGGTGNDSLNGGDGTDTADFSDKTTAILLTLNGSTAANATIGTEIDSLINIENAWGGSSNDVLTGDANANTLYGNAGNDTLSGAAGNDSLRGGAGNDSLNGGDGTDTADFSDKTTAILLTLNSSTAANATIGTEIDSVINIENAWGGSAADTITGDVNANTLYGNAGNDTLSGAAGNDSLRGGTGNDSLNGGDGTDTADFSDKTTAILLTLNSSTAANATIGTEIDSLINIENILGGSGADNITGDANNNSFRGGGGNDTLNGGSGTDTADFSDKTTAILLTLNGSTAANATIGTEIDSLINIESVFGGSGADNITGDLNANTLYGNAGNDTLSGGDGNDTIEGGQGLDQLTGNLGSDQFLFLTSPTTSSRDFITDFATGVDQLAFSRAVFLGFGTATSLAANQYRSGAGATSATSSTERFLYDTTTGILRFDQDGNGSLSSAIEIAQLNGTTIPTLNLTDFLLTS